MTATTLVLVAKGDEQSLRWLNYIFIPSFLTNWSHPARFMIVCPRDQAASFASIAAALHPDVIPEDFLPDIELLQPYQRQMALKIAVSEIVDTTFYLTLDCDCVFLPGDEAALYHGGKPLLHANQSQHYYHRFWLENCNQITGNRRYVEPMIGFTPQVLIAPHARAVKQFIERAFNRTFASALAEWDRKFALAKNALLQGIESIPHDALKPALVSGPLLRNHHSWTEYTLYWSFMLNGYLETDYSTEEPLCDKFYTGRGWASHIARPFRSLRKQNSNSTCWLEASLTTDRLWRSYSRPVVQIGALLLAF